MAELRSHPTAKPVALVGDAFEDCTRRGDIVLDTFSLLTGLHPPGCSPGAEPPLQAHNRQDRERDCRKSILDTGDFTNIRVTDTGSAERPFLSVVSTSCADSEICFCA
jgi:hypothetical protein